MIVLTLHEIPDDDFNELMKKTIDPNELWVSLLEDVCSWPGLFVFPLDHDRKRATDAVNKFVVNYEACHDD